jgi:MFS family permease
MFLQYAVPGALVPLFSLRLQELGFTPLEIGWACATQALAALVSPLVAGQVADRWFPAERCLAACAFASATTLWVLAELTSPSTVFGTSLVFWLLMGPVLTLGISVSFAHLERPERDFGPVRMWGTVGWMVPGWLLGYWFSNPEWLIGGLALLRPARPSGELADAFRLAGLFGFVLGAYALTLSPTPPKRRAGAWLAPLAALSLLRGRAFAIYGLCQFGVCVTVPFSIQVTPLLLEALGVPRPWLGPTLTLAQSTEMVALWLLPVLLLRLGIRGTMLVGLLAWAGALGILTLGQPTWLVVASQGLNGLCICCYIVAGQVFVNSRAHGEVRASAQALLAFVNGLGMLAGNLLVGGVRRQVNGEFRPTFAVGAAIALGLVVIFALGFREAEGRPDEW